MEQINAKQDVVSYGKSYLTGLLINFFPLHQIRGAGLIGTLFWHHGPLQSRVLVIFPLHIFMLT